MLCQGLRGLMLIVMLEVDIMHEPKVSALSAKSITEASEFNISIKPQVYAEWVLKNLLPISWHSYCGFSNEYHYNAILTVTNHFIPCLF